MVIHLQLFGWMQLQFIEGGEEALDQGNDQINKIIADLEYFHILSCFDRMTSYAHCQFIYT